jgi:hypothetical protein
MHEDLLGDGSGFAVSHEIDCFSCAYKMVFELIGLLRQAPLDRQWEFTVFSI